MFFFGYSDQGDTSLSFSTGSPEVVRAMNDAESLRDPPDSCLFRSIHRNITPRTKKREDVAALVAQVWNAYIIRWYQETD